MGDLELDDGTNRIFLSAQGDKDDISLGLKALLNYIAEKAPESYFTKRLDDQVKRAREHEEWRIEYMTLLERDEMMREEGRKQGREEGRAEERVRTAAETKRADAEKVRADAAVERVRQLEKLLAEYRKT